MNPTGNSCLSYCNETKNQLQNTLYIAIPVVKLMATMKSKALLLKRSFLELRKTLLKENRFTGGLD